MYVAKPGQSCTIRACMLEYTCLLFLGGYLGQGGGGGGGVKTNLIINFMSILMQFLTFLKTNLRAKQCSHRFKLNLITLLVTLLCKWGQIIIRYDFLGAR